jgi:hypothetical protein
LPQGRGASDRPGSDIAEHAELIRIVGEIDRLRRPHRRGVDADRDNL